MKNSNDKDIVHGIILYRDLVFIKYFKFVVGVQPFGKTNPIHIGFNAEIPI
nr:hypothetical protein [Paenibacillus lautus]